MPQENNMAEVIRLLHTVIGKVDGLATGLEKVEADVQVLKADVQVLKADVQVLKADVGRLETKMDGLDEKVNIFSGRFQDVARVVIEDTQRVTGLENRVDNLERKAY